MILLIIKINWWILLDSIYALYLFMFKYKNISDSSLRFFLSNCMILCNIKIIKKWSTFLAIRTESVLMKISIQSHSCCSWSFVLIITIDHERPRMTTNENVVRGLFWSFLNKLKITTNDKESFRFLCRVEVAIVLILNHLNLRLS